MPLSHFITWPIYATTGATVYGLADVVGQKLDRRIGLEKNGKGGKRIMYFSMAGACVGALVKPAVALAPYIIPNLANPTVTMIARAALLELMVAPVGVLAGVGASWLSGHNETKEDIKEKLYSIDGALLPHLAMAPLWAMVTGGIQLPIPGAHYGLPAIAFLSLAHLPYMIFLSRFSFRPASHGRVGPIQTLVHGLHWEMGDFVSRYSLMALGYWVVCGYFNCMAQMFNDKFGMQGVIWDPLFHILPRTERGPWVDLLCPGSALLIVIHSIFQKDPALPVVLRRVMLVYGTILLARSMTLPLFFWLPAPDLSCVSHHPWGFFKSVLMVEFGGGRTCHDLIFSGHTILYSLSALYYQKNTKRKWLKGFAWAYSGTAMVLTVASHAHYTYDVVSALLVCSLIWNQYHKLIETAEADPRDCSIKSSIANFFRFIEHAPIKDKIVEIDENKHEIKDLKELKNE